MNTKELSWSPQFFATSHLQGVQPGCQVTVCDLGNFATAAVSIKHRWEPVETIRCKTLAEAKAWAEDAARRHGAIE